MRGLADFADSELPKLLEQGGIEVMVLFLPALGAEEKHVVPAMRFLQADSVHYYWSRDREVMALFGRSIGHEVDLYDFWAIYDEGSRWVEEPPMPSFWQHQMVGLPEGKRLDVQEFSDQLSVLSVNEEED